MSFLRVFLKAYDSYDDKRLTGRKSLQNEGGRAKDAKRKSRKVAIVAKGAHIYRADIGHWRFLFSARKANSVFLSFLFFRGIHGGYTKKALTRFLL